VRWRGRGASPGAGRGGVTGHRTQRPRGQVGPHGPHPAGASSPLEDPGGERWPIPPPLASGPFDHAAGTCSWSPTRNIVIYQSDVLFCARSRPRFGCESLRSALCSLCVGIARPMRCANCQLPTHSILYLREVHWQDAPPICPLIWALIALGPKFPKAFQSGCGMGLGFGVWLLLLRCCPQSTSPLNLPCHLLPSLPT
jgi:hypothetical protein